MPFRAYPTLFDCVYLGVMRGGAIGEEAEEEEKKEEEEEEWG